MNFSILNRIILATIFSVVLVFFAPVGSSNSVTAQILKPAGNTIDKGDFKVGFSPARLKVEPKKKMPKEISDPVNEIAVSLNSVIALPFDVYLNYDECGEPNAFYSSEFKEITMCYEFLADMDEAFKQISKNPKEVDEMTEGTMVVFFFHELGHCLIDVWDLPSTGREEDAVDQLALFVLLDGTPEGEDMVLSAVTFFDIVSRQGNNDELAFWDEHSLNQQRFYDMLCLTYGSNPAQNKHLLGKNKLPPERAERCPAEYNRVNHSWAKLLAPYLKSS